MGTCSARVDCGAPAGPSFGFSHLLCVREDSRVLCDGLASIFGERRRDRCTSLCSATPTYVAQEKSKRMETAPEINFEQIRERAYDLWERNHKPEGFDIEFWLMAERELRAERGRRRSQVSASKERKMSINPQGETEEGRGE